MTEVHEAEIPPQTNGIDALDDEERSRIRPADIDADVREMERRKRVEHIMNSRMFREELERIIETQLTEGVGTSSLMQQISDMMGVNKHSGNVYKNSSCVLPINDIRGVEAMGYTKGEKILRCKLAAVYRLIDLYGWAQGATSLITARLNQDEEHFLVNPYGMLFHEITASSLIKVDMQANVVEQGTTNFSVNISAFSLHGAVHAARPDIKCIIHLHTPSVVAISALKSGILPISQESVVIGEVSTHPYLGGLLDPEEQDKLARNLGPINKVLLLSNQGALCCGLTIEEAFFNARNTVLACESQLKLLPVGLDNLVLLNEETQKRIYEAAHQAPESSPRPDKPSILEVKVERKWRVGGIEFEGLMRMLDNVGFRTGYIYRHPLVKGEPPRPKNDVECPPAVSSLGYLLEEEELYRKGLWRNLGDGRKGQSRSRWLNSPNVYQRVEILETGTQDPKKITKWVADGSPTHSSTPVRIESALQFVPKNTDPKEFKQKQQQIKDYRRADKISAGPQSYILDTLTWEEAKNMQDASVTQTGDQVVLMGAASKGIIQRGHQHNAMMYKSPYAKNPFDSVTDEDLDEYKKVVEKKVKGDYDTDYSESELSSAQINKRIDGIHLRSPTSETEEESRDEPQVLRIETKQAPRPSQPEVVLSDVETPLSPTEQLLKAERVSMNSYRSYKMVMVDRNPSFYRTNSHAGFPKGSYSIPNPIHFHIARENQIAKIMRPTLIKVVPFNYRPSNYLFSNSDRQPPLMRRPVVTVNIGHSHSVCLDIPLETLRGFILPFVDALNIRSIPTLNTQSCQTSYMNNFEYQEQNLSDLRNMNYTVFGNDPENMDDSEQTVSFERHIIKKMQNKLMTIMDDTISTDAGSDLESDDTSINFGKLVHFDENDQEDRNESLADMDLFITEYVKINNANMDINIHDQQTMSSSESLVIEQEVNVLTSDIVDCSSNDECESPQTLSNGTCISSDSIANNWDDTTINHENMNYENVELVSSLETTSSEITTSYNADYNIPNKKLFSSNTDSLPDEVIWTQNSLKGDTQRIAKIDSYTVGNSNKLRVMDTYNNVEINAQCNRSQKNYPLNESIPLLVKLANEHSKKFIGISDDITIIRDVIADAKNILCHMPFNSVDDSDIIDDVINSSIDTSSNNGDIDVARKVRDATCSTSKHLEHATTTCAIASRFPVGVPSNSNSSKIGKCNEINQVVQDECFLLRNEQSKNKEPGQISTDDGYSCKPDVNRNNKGLNSAECTLSNEVKAHETVVMSDYFNNNDSNLRDMCESSKEMINEILDMNENIGFSNAASAQNINVLENLVDHIDTLSADEGIEDCLEDCVTTSNNYSVETSLVSLDQNVEKLSDVVFDYLVQQCFEVTELVLFPEILHDQNINKLLVDLKQWYETLYPDSLSAEEKTELRINISFSILKRLEIDSNSSNDSTEDSSSLNIVSDKIFTISEFVSDILDNFFELVTQSDVMIVEENENGESFLDFIGPLRCDIGRLLHSSPEGYLANINESSFNEHLIVEFNKPPITTSCEVEEVISFQKDVSSKSGVETFWFSCTPLNNKKAIVKSRATINVDDIPLNPPKDIDVFTRCSLYPIPEEPISNLFDPGYDEVASNDESEGCCNEMYESSTSPNGTNSLDDILGGSDTHPTYVSLNEPEINVVVCNEVHFFRTCTVNSSAYVRRDNVVFTQNDLNTSANNLQPSSDKIDDFEGDWMGFDKAKF